MLIALVLLEICFQFLPERYFARTKYFEGDALLAIPLTNPVVTDDFPDAVKPDDVYRIIVLGDSQTVSVGRKKSYPEVLETLLNADERVAKRVEVYNGGAPGHSHYQYYLSLKERLNGYQPDLVIVGSYLGNDFLDLLRNDDRPNLSLAGEEFVHADPQFYKYYDPDDTTFDHLPRVLRIGALLFDRTIGYEFSRVRVMWSVGERGHRGSWEAARYVSAITKGHFVSDGIFRQSMNQLLFLKRFPDQMQAVDQVVREITQRMQRLADQDGFKLLYMPIPTKIQIEPDSDKEIIDETLEVCGLDRSDLALEDELRELLISALAEHDIASCRIDEALKQAAENKVLYDNTYHIIPFAHHIVAQALLECVVPMVEMSAADALK